MKALVLSNFNEIGVQDIPEPKASGHFVKIKVAYAGVCGTDLHAIAGEYSRTRVPVVLGHEVSGVISDVGEAVTKVKVGDCVTSETTLLSCGTCPYCLSGELNLCPSRVGIGTNANGAYAEYMISHEDRVHKLPESVSLFDACLTEPLACGVHACMETVNVKAGDWVCVFGAGAVGVLLAEAVKSLGAYVILAGLSSDREILRQELEFGLDVVVDQDNTDLEEVIMSKTCGLGVDYVFECSGAIPALLQSFNIVRKKGKIVQMGIYSKPMVGLPMETILQNEIQLIGSRSQRPSSWPKALELLKNRKVIPSHVLGNIFPLSQWKNALYEKSGGRKNVISFMNS